jgi:bifunctional pyridoxal-dependent enzyme with beta-cystathionase and maltose regulon repressor activities
MEHLHHLAHVVRTVLAGVACLAGTGFGPYGEGHLRFSYANSREIISRALERMDEILHGSPGKTSQATRELTSAIKPDS